MPDAAREDFTGDGRGCSRPERGDGLKGAAILVADRKAIEQVLDRGQSDALEIRRTSGAHALQVLKRRIERYRRQMLKVEDGAYCTTVDVPVPTRISRIFAGSSNGASMLIPSGLAGVFE